MKLNPLRSLPFKLFLAATMLQAAMLGLLLWNNLGLMDEKLIERTDQRLQDEKQLLAASLRPALRNGDVKTARTVLEGLREGTRISYFVLFDAAGAPLAAAGRDPAAVLPPPQERITDVAQAAAASESVFDTSVVVTDGAQRLGELRFGVPTGFLRSARADLIRESLLIGGAALLVSMVLTASVAYVMTRRLERLTRATERMAEGHLDVELPVGSEDEAGRLTRAFNRMAQALRTRLAALQESEGKFHAIADYSYDTELWINPRGKVIWVNPRAYDMFGYTPEECLEMDNFPVQFVEPEDAPADRQANSTRVARQHRAGL